MAEPLKNLYTPKLIKNLSTEISLRHPSFNHKTFNQSIFDSSWGEKELKQRIRHITLCLHTQLPNDYKKAIAVLKPVAEKFNGFEYLFFQDYVECFGLAYFKISMLALAHFTQYASSEFAVRPFIINDENRMMKQMLLWAKSDNHHIRRLASEGCRPRLPWAMALPAFKENPDAIFKILKILMLDDSDYVRRSVANNLNDISKDHPLRVLQWCRQWQGKHKYSDWIIKHACRTLLKQAHPDALSLFDYKKPVHITLKKFKIQKTVKRGDRVHFSFLLSGKKTLGKLRIEFAIGFMRANGKQAEKVFKISESDYHLTEKAFEKNYSFKPISTRKYYSGKHTLSIIVNGNRLINGLFILQD